MDGEDQGDNRRRRMRVAKILFVCHLAALVIGLGCLLLILPHPELWDTNPIGENIFQFVLRSAGTLHVILGAATMLLFGLLFVGLRKTLIFFVGSTLVSLIMALLATSRSSPFGVDAYPTLPGFKVAGIVPYSIPLSLFYMGFTSYLLSSKLTSGLRLRGRTLWSLFLGTYLLAIWGLALNSALASEHLPWLWHEYGSYFGIPIHNLFGWMLNGMIFMSLSGLILRTNFGTQHLAIWLPFGVYIANTGFAIVLNLGVGLWFPLFLTVFLVLLPESLVLFSREEKQTSFRRGSGRLVLSQFIWLLMRAGIRIIGRRKLDLHAEGLEHLPRSGPVLIAARHFHFFYDGFTLIRIIPRRLHTIVALDWVRTRPLRFLIELGCAMADWPVVLRSEQLREQRSDGRKVYTPVEGRQYLRHVALDVARLLRSGEILVIFPEAYPNIDPHPTPKSDLDAFLPFRPGFIKLAELAERDRKTRVAIVPVGLNYTRERGKRWHATVRFGQALFLSDFASDEQVLHAVEERVHALSCTISPSISSHTPEEVPPS